MSLPSLGCSLLVLLPLGTPQQRATDTVSLEFGLYQSDKATVMYTKFAPIIECIQTDAEKRLGRPVDIRLEIFPTYEDGIVALAEGTVDFARFGPAPYITAKAKNPGIELLAMEEEDGLKRFKGMIVVAKSSPITTITDLKGKSFAFGDPNSTIGRYLVQAELVKAGIRASDLSKFAFLDRHDKVARAVQVGDYDAGSVKASNYEELKESLRVVIAFDNVTKPWVARAGLDRDVAAALQQSLFALKDPGALKELKISGFTNTSDAEYQLVRDGMKQAEAFEAKPKTTPR